MKLNDESIRMQQQIVMIENEAKKHLDSNALSRYSNLKVVHPEKALQVAAIIVQATQTNQFPDILDDTQLKELLIKLQEPSKEFRIKRR